MVELFLSRPNVSNEGDGDSCKTRISLLNKVESIIWSLMTSGGQSEARLWLCKTLAGITSITPRHHRELFLSLLRSKPLNKGLASQLLQMIFDKRPHKAGSVIAKRSYILEKFFEGNPRRISQWFSNFASGGGSEHGKGARALSQFAFINRDICWEELEWKGKHGQSPAVVATKPHYFLDLDVQQTVENFLENVPEFWSSVEFSDSLKDGEILFIDRKFFLEYFVDLMIKDDSGEVWELINEFLIEETFSYLCQHLLITLEESEFCKFLGILPKFLNPKMEPNYFGNSSYLFEVMLYKCRDCGSIDQILLLNAVMNQGRQLVQLFRDEEAEKERAKVKTVVTKICALPSHTNSLVPIFEECCKRKTLEAITWLGLQSWVLHYTMSEECQTLESWESLFNDNAISFRRKFDEYSLLDSDGSSGEGGFELEHTTSTKVTRRKRRKSRKKRRRDFDKEDSYDNELLDAKSDRPTLQLNSGNWLLSIDGYTACWNAVDLPEHLAKHCMSLWMQWVFANWDEASLYGST